LTVAVQLGLTYCDQDKGGAIGPPFVLAEIDGREIASSRKELSLFRFFRAACLRACSAEFRVPPLRPTKKAGFIPAFFVGRNGWFEESLQTARIVLVYTRFVQFDELALKSSLRC